MITFELLNEPVLNIRTDLRSNSILKSPGV